MDIINLLSALNPGGPLAALRSRRPGVQDNLQHGFEVLLEPLNPGTFSFGERYAVATYLAGVHGVANALTFYSELLLDDAPATLRDAVLAAVAQGRSTGPYGSYREPDLAGESEPGGVVHHDPRQLGDRLAAALDVAHLMVFHPRDARPEVLGRLSSAGWNVDDTVSLCHLVAFLSCQLRLIHGLQVLNGQPQVSSGERAAGVAADWELSARGFEISTGSGLPAPSGFVARPLDWQPWLSPPAVGEPDPVLPARSGDPFFRLLARDPQALAARTLVELDLGRELAEGLAPAEQELVATVTARLNGCLHGVSVHAGRAASASGQAAALDRLLKEGVSADLGGQLWQAVAAATVALGTTPMQFGESQVRELRAAGLGDPAILDLLTGAAFANSTDRLRLLLGQPTVGQPQSSR